MRARPIARLLIEQGIGVRMIEADRDRARYVAAELPKARVYHATGFDPDFLDRERIADAQVAIFAMRDDMKNHFAATLAKVHGARFTVAIVHDAPSQEVFEHAGIDVTVNPRQITAEEIVRFAHDPRTQQVVMLEGDRFEVLDITTRPDSEYVGLTLQGDADQGRADRRDRAQRRRRSSRAATTCFGPVTARSSSPSRGACPRSRRRCEPAPGVPGRRRRRRAPHRRHAHRLSQPRHARPGGGRARVRRARVAVSRLGRARGRDRRLAVALATRGDHRLNVREGFLVVSLTWLAAAALGALPYIFSGDPQIDRPIDAYFEGMSGFSTTGGSIVVNVEELPRGLAMWRQFTQWLGGIGIIVLALAVLPRLRVGGRQLLEHEMPGPEIESLSTRIRDTARRVWILYIALTVVLLGIFLALWATGVDEEMTPFQAFAHAFTTIPTGGFSTKVELDRGVRAGDAVGGARLHGARRDQLRADVPRDRAPPAARRRPRPGAAALPRPCSRSARSSS